VANAVREQDVQARSLSSCLCKLIYFLGGSGRVSGVGDSIGGRV
jgi:hypothetical protein